MNYPYREENCQSMALTTSPGFASSISHANLERPLLAAQTSKLELETELWEKELLVER